MNIIEQRNKEFEEKYKHMFQMILETDTDIIDFTPSTELQNCIKMCYLRFFPSSSHFHTHSMKLVLEEVRKWAEINTTEVEDEQSYMEVISPKSLFRFLESINK